MHPRQANVSLVASPRKYGPYGLTHQASMNIVPIRPNRRCTKVHTHNRLRWWEPLFNEHRVGRSIKLHPHARTHIAIRPTTLWGVLLWSVLAFSKEGRSDSKLLLLRREIPCEHGFMVRNAVTVNGYKSWRWMLLFYRLEKVVGWLCCFSLFYALVKFIFLFLPVFIFWSW